MFAAENNNVLFNSGDVRARAELIERVGATTAVNKIATERFAHMTDEEVRAEALQHLITPPLTIDEKAPTSIKKEEVNVSESGSVDALWWTGSDYAPGVLVRYALPYAGTSNLWQLRPYADFGRTARGTIRESGDYSGTLEMTLVARGDDARAELDETLQRNLEDIRACISAQTPILEAMNQRLPQMVDVAIEKRRARLALLDAIHVERQNVPSAKQTPLVIELQKVPPAIAEPFIEFSDTIHEQLLDLLRQYGRGLERTPKTMRKLEEEEIRDILLALLNTHYPATPLTAETFRGKGPADITLAAIEKEAFVAECKIWRGPQSLKDAIDQVLNRYVLWGDARCAVLMFNIEVQGVSEIAEKIPALMDAHPRAKSQSVRTKRGEWRVEVAPENDPSASITLHVFLFNFYID